MAHVKSQELRSMAEDKLQDLYNDKKQDLYVIRQQMASGELKDTSAVKRVRREIARIVTIMAERKKASGN